MSSGTIKIRGSKRHPILASSFDDLVDFFGTFGFYYSDSVENHLVAKGYVLVTYEDPEDAIEAVKNMDGYVWDGSIVLRVKFFP